MNLLLFGGAGLMAAMLRKDNVSLSQSGVVS